MIMKKTKICFGFTIVELLIALTLMGMLISAVALAFDASTVSYRENEDIINVVNVARQTLIRITTQLRTASAVSTTDPANTCTFITADGQDITYSYDAGAQKLYLITNDDATDADYVLCDNVTAMTFDKAIEADDTGQDYVESVQISITLSSGNVTRSLSTAVAIRRNL